jgi:1-acyl-sn-glycerol-3-phosphate acyltransferase
MTDVIATVWFWTFMVVTSVVLFPIAALLRLLSFPFDRRLVMLHRFTSLWGSLYTWCNPLWSVTIEGTEHLSNSTPFVIVANHQSFADILVLFRLRFHYKWVSKAENFRVPLIGWNMTLNRYIRLDRGSVRGNLQMMRNCDEALHGGSSVMIFPEGTRSPDGELRPFKDGAFDLALKTHSPILPIAIDGTAEALPKRGILLQGKRRIRICILPPLLPSAFTQKSAKDLNRATWQRIHETLVSLRRGPEEQGNAG